MTTKKDETPKPELSDNKKAVIKALDRSPEMSVDKLYGSQADRAYEQPC